jgi:hypothetical protein
MPNLRIEIAGDDLFCTDGIRNGASSRKPLGASGLARLKGWAEAYDAAVRMRQPSHQLLSIGREIATLLNGGDGWLEGCLESATGELRLEIGVSLKPGELGPGNCWSPTAPSWPPTSTAFSASRGGWASRRKPHLPTMATWRSCSWPPKWRGSGFWTMSGRRPLS